MRSCSRVNAASSRLPSKRASVLRSTSASKVTVCAALSTSVRCARAGNTRIATARPTMLPSAISNTRSAAETSGSTLLGLANSMMAAVTGAMRML